MLDDAFMQTCAAGLPVVSPVPPELRVLQLGMGWFPEQAGGSNRMYYGLMQHFAAAGVRADGIVAGQPTRMPGTPHLSSFASHQTRLPTRLLRARQLARARDLDAYQLACSHFALYT